MSFTYLILYSLICVYSVCKLVPGTSVEDRKSTNAVFIILGFMSLWNIVNLHEKISEPLTYCTHSLFVESFNCGQEQVLISKCNFCDHRFDKFLTLLGPIAKVKFQIVHSCKVLIGFSLNFAFGFRLILTKNVACL